MAKSYRTIRPILCIGLLLTFASCTSLDPTQRIAVEHVRSHISCPSTMKVIECTTSIVPEYIHSDTVYHIHRTHGYGKDAANYAGYWRVCASIDIDSLRITDTTEPAHTQCLVTFDAQNLMGAVVRDRDLICIYDGMPYYYEAWSRHVSATCATTRTIPVTMTLTSDDTHRLSEYHHNNYWCERNMLYDRKF